MFLNKFLGFSTDLIEDLIIWKKKVYQKISWIKTK